MKNRNIQNILIFELFRRLMLSRGLLSNPVVASSSSYNSQVIHEYFLQYVQQLIFKNTAYLCLSVQSDSRLNLNLIKMSKCKLNYRTYLLIHNITGMFLNINVYIQYMSENKSSLYRDNGISRLRKCQALITVSIILYSKF